MADRLRFRYRTPLLWLLTLSVMAYALFEEYRPNARHGITADGDSEPDTEGDKLRIVSVEPSELAPGAATFVRIAGVDPDRTLAVYAVVSKQPAEVLRRSDDQLVVRVPPGLEYGQAKLRVLQGDRRSKGWALHLQPLPRHDMLRDIVGGLALFVLGLRTVGRSLRAYAGQRVRLALSRLTRDRPRSLGLGTVVGLLMQSTTSAAGLFAGLLGARMVKLPASVVLMIGAQLGAAAAAVLLPRFATGEALWVLAIGALWVLLAESRLSRALGSIVVGSGMIFHGLGLVQAGCAPLISDPQVVPYLSYLQANSLGGVLACAAAGAILSALLQGPAPLYALALSLLQEDVLGLRDAVAILTGVSLGALCNTFAAAWVFGTDARRLVRSQFPLSLAMTVLSVAGLPAWLWVAERVAATGGSATPAMTLGLGAAFLALQASTTLLGFALVPLGMRASTAWSRRVSLRPTRAIGPAQAEALLRALTLCHDGLSGVREIIDSSDRSSAPATEHALEQARDILRDILRATPNDAAEDAPPKAASVACLHLADALLSTLRVAEKAPELGFSPSGEGARALERLHDMLDKALTSVCDQLAHDRTLSLIDAQAREIEINAVEAETRRRLFADASTGEDLALRLWSSELCAAYETVGNQVYRAASAVSARSDDD